MFTNSAEEPSSETRQIVLTVYQPSTNTSCLVLVTIQLVNDNRPVLDLNGPNKSGINYTTTVSYYLYSNNLFGNVVRIAPYDITITDDDADSRIISIELTLSPGMEGDRIFMVCQPLYENREAGSCYLR